MFTFGITQVKGIINAESKHNIKLFQKNKGGALYNVHVYKFNRALNTLSASHVENDLLQLYVSTYSERAHTF